MTRRIGTLVAVFGLGILGRARDERPPDGRDSRESCKVHRLKDDWQLGAMIRDHVADKGGARVKNIS